MESEAILTVINAYSSDSAADEALGKQVAEFKAIDEHLCGDLGGEAVILSLKSGKYYGLNSLGTRIWELLQKPGSRESIERVILDEFDVDPHECRNEIDAFMSHLESEELIERVNGTSAKISKSNGNGKVSIS